MSYKTIEDIFGENWKEDYSIYINHVIKHSFVEFVKFYHFAQTGEQFILNQHHIVICDTLERVVKGEIKNLIINLPPGYSKTLLSVIYFSAWSLAVNKSSKMLHTSYSDDLAALNSQSVKDIILSEEYQAIFPQEIRVDSKAKKRWANTRRGGMYAAASNGAITGFRAGAMLSGYSGALVIDDPVKPMLNNSLTDINKVNERYMSTLRNRIAHPDVPIIIIMQRLHEDDLCGYLLKGATKEKWHHLELPAFISSSSREYPDKYTHGIPIEHSLPEGSLWPYKNSIEDLKLIEMSDKYTYACQYNQDPVPRGALVFDTGRFLKHSSYDGYRNSILSCAGKEIKLINKIITCDTALKTGDKNDHSVFQLWGQGTDNIIYLLDQVRGKWESYDLEKQLLAFVDKHKYAPKINTIGVRQIYCEDKASGTGLIQSLNNQYGSSFIAPVQRNKDKVSRALQAARWLLKDKVSIPTDEPFTDNFILEVRDFSAMGNSKVDDQVDTLCDAIDILLDGGSFTGYSWV